MLEAEVALQKAVVRLSQHLLAYGGRCTGQQTCGDPHPSSSFSSSSAAWVRVRVRVRVWVRVRVRVWV